MKRPFDTFLGVDLGGGRGKSTAVARLRANGSKVRVVGVGTRDQAGQAYFDEVLVRFLLEHSRGSVLAIDAPLTLPVCLRCQLGVCPGFARCLEPAAVWLRRAAASRPDGGQIGASAEADAGADRDGTGGRAAASVKPQVTAYTQRAIEIHLQRALGIVPRETLGQGMGPLTARAQHLVRALAESYRLNRNLIEVYPRATVHQLFGARRARRYKRQADPWKSRAEILEELSHELEFAVWREGCLSNDHCFDAVLCAYTAYLWARDGWEMPPEEAGLFLADGWIWVPPAAARGPATGKAGAG